MTAEGRLTHDSTLEATALVHLVPLESRWRDPRVNGQLARADSIIAPTALGLRAAAQCARAAARAAEHRPGALEAAEAGAGLAQQAGDARAHTMCVFTGATILAIRGDVDSAIPACGWPLTKPQRRNSTASARPSVNGSDTNCSTSAPSATRSRCCGSRATRGERLGI